MPETLPVAAAVELARVERGGFVESRHAGAAIVLNPEGQAIERLGDTDAPILPRSSLKPIQALACLAAGAQLADETLALATASHAG
ncbi:MAG TPA: asparaginase, partial [Microbacterium sp.]|nr:asparaginase [Microbacterium sp.]